MINVLGLINDIPVSRYKAHKNRQAQSRLNEVTNEHYNIDEATKKNPKYCSRSLKMFL